VRLTNDALTTVL